MLSVRSSTGSRGELLMLVRHHKAHYRSNLHKILGMGETQVQICPLCNPNLEPACHFPSDGPVAWHYKVPEHPLCKAKWQHSLWHKFQPQPHARHASVASYPKGGKRSRSFCFWFSRNYNLHLRIIFPLKLCWKWHVLDIFSLLFSFY